MKYFLDNFKPNFYYLLHIRSEAKFLEKKSKIEGFATKARLLKNPRSGDTAKGFFVANTLDKKGGVTRPVTLNHDPIKVFWTGKNLKQRRLSWPKMIKIQDSVFSRIGEPG